MEQKQNKTNGRTTKQILVLGAGFGGLRAALDAAKLMPWANVVLVSHEDHHYYPPIYYELATTMRVDGPAFKLKGTAGFSVNEIISRRKNIIFKQAWVESIDLDRKLVRTDNGDLVYDFLVVALGSQTDYFGVDGLGEYSSGLKTFADAITLRNRLAKALEGYKQTGDPAFLNFVIGGGGFTGVELAAEMVNYLKHLKKQYATFPPIKLYMVEGAPQLVPGVLPAAGAAILKRLKSLGIEVILENYVTDASDSAVRLSSNREIPTKTLIWTGGVKSAALPFIKNLACDKKGRVMVSSRLNLDAYPEVFLVGDCACYMDPVKNAPLPPTAQVAVHQARFVARAIKARLTNQEVPVYRPLRHHQFLIPLSGKYACFVSKNKIYVGFWPYILRRLADLRYFMSLLPFFKALNYWLKGSLVYVKND